MDGMTQQQMDEANAAAWNSMLVDPAAALVTSEAILEAARASGYRSGEASALINKGWCLHFLGRMRESLAAFSEAELSAERGDDERMAALRNGMGSGYFELGLYDEAMICFEEALASAKRAGAWDRAVGVLVNLGWICDAIGHHDEGLPWLEEALAISKREGAAENLGPLYSCLAAMDRGLGRTAEAASWLDRIEDLPGLEADPGTAASLHLERGALAMQEGDLPAAEASLRRGLSLYPEGVVEGAAFSGMLRLASCVSLQGRHEEASALAEDALSRIREAGLDLALHDACDEYALILERAGRYRDALAASREAREAERRLRSEAAQFRMDLMRKRREERYREQELGMLQDLNERLMESNDILQQVTVISHLVASAAPWGERVAGLFDRLSALTGCALLGIAALEEDRKAIVYRHLAVEGGSLPPLELEHRLGANASSLAIDSAEPLVVRDGRAEKARIAPKAEWAPDACQSAIFLPLSFHEGGKGLLTVQRRETGDFPEQTMEILAAIGPLVATAMENYYAFQRLNELNRDLEREKSRLVEAKERIEHVAMHDPLTGLLNRLSLEHFYEIAAPSAERLGKLLCLVFIDLNEFKPINDVFGHQAGDEALKAVARALSAVTRGGDAKARIGGDEFVVLALIGSDGEARRVADKVRKALSFRLPWAGQSLEVSASIGWALSGADGTNLAALIRAADGRMYEEKSLLKGKRPRREPEGS